MRLSVAFDFAVHAYCFMPDHVHVLLEGTSGGSSLQPYVERWKQVTGHWFTRTRSRRLWQSGYYDRVLREDEPMRVVARYIVGNPIRAGLADQVGQYPFAWCVWDVAD
jgi:putative transposase